jgi:tetratricopeptide (TPR) repeat protein
MVRMATKLIVFVLLWLCCIPAPGICQGSGLPILSPDLLSDKRFLQASAMDFQVFKLMEARRYQEALPLALKAWENFKATLGSQHPRTLTSLNNIGFLYNKLDQRDKARPIYEQVLKSREEVLGPNHLHTATSLNNLAVIYERMGLYEQALPLYERSLKIYELRKGKDDPSTVSIRNNKLQLEHLMRKKAAEKTSK